MQLNAYFTSIATTLLANHHNLVSETAPEPVSPYIRTFNFSLRNEHEVFKALKELDQSKATGCDGISVKALNISLSLSHLFNELLRTGQFPSVWKIARVTPRPPHSPTQHSQYLQHSPPPPPPHSPTDCDNYRPILVLPCILKIMESFVNTDLRKFTHEVGLIEQHQFAYSKFSSVTVTVTVTMVIESHRAVKTARDVRMSYGDSLLEPKRSFKYLGAIVDKLLSWNSCISYVASRVLPQI